MTEEVKPGVLIVEDDGLMAMELEDTVKVFGYSIAGTTGNGTEAVLMAGAEPTDLVLMDVGLKGEIDGIDAAREIRYRYQIPIVFVTGNHGPDLFTRMCEADPAGYLTKPFRAEELRASLAIARNQHRRWNALAAEKSGFQAALTDLNACVVTTDASGCVQFMNEAAENLTGWRTAEALGKPFRSLCDVRITGAKSGLPNSADARREKERVLLRTRSGRWVTAEECTFPIQENGKAAATIAAYFDISERAGTERNLERQRTAMEERGRRASALLRDARMALNHVSSRSMTAMGTHLAEDVHGREAKEMKDAMQEIVKAAHEAFTTCSVLADFRCELKLYDLEPAGVDEMLSSLRKDLLELLRIAPIDVVGQFTVREGRALDGKARSVPAGHEPSLTPRQNEVLRMVAEGMSGKEIGARLNISTRTVEFHKKAVMEALDSHTTAGLTMWAIRLGLIHLDGWRQ